MQQLDVEFDDADGMLSGWPPTDRSKIIHLGNGAGPMRVGVLSAGMTSGLPSVMIRHDLPDGQVVLAETSARLFCAAAKMIMARYPKLFEGE